MCWRRIRIARKKRRIRRRIRQLPHGSVLLAEDETDVLLFPPLRANWSRRGQPARVFLTGWNARRVVFGAINLRSGKRLFLPRQRGRQHDFQAFLELIHRHYRNRRVALLLDENPCHTAQRSRQRADDLRIELLWLPKRAPELNPMDELWGQGKDIVSANLQYRTIDDHLHAFIEYLECLTNGEARWTAGILSDNFWLKSVL